MCTRSSVNSQIKSHSFQVHPMGKPLWEFDKPSEFLEGALDALKGLEYMYEAKEIFHRDVSAGNIYLWDVQGNNGSNLDTDMPARGFVADLEFAYVPEWAPRDAMESQRYEDASRYVSAVKYSLSSGSMRKGTVQFMAYEVLKNATVRKGGLPEQEIAHAHHCHDLESFILVLYYTIYKKSTAGKRNSKNPTDKKLVAELDAMFGNPDGQGVLDIRSKFGTVQDYLCAYLNKNCPVLRGFCRNLSYELRDTYNGLPSDEEENNRFTERADKMQLKAGGDVPQSYSITFQKLEVVLKEWIQALEENQEDNHFKAER